VVDPRWRKPRALMGLPLALTFAALAAGAARLIVTRVRAARHARRAFVLESTKAVPAASDPAFLGQLAKATGMTFTHDNEIEVVRNSDGIINRLYEDIGRARASVTLQVYFARPGAVADDLADIMGRRARAGVNVRVLFDALGCRGLSDAYFVRLRASGVEVHLMRPLRWYAPHRFTYRAHSRIAIIDGRIGYTGGFGIADAWRDGPNLAENWQDISVRFTGSTVAAAQKAFAEAWEETTGERLHGPALFPSLRGSGSQTAAFLRTAPCEGRFGARALFEHALSSARRSIYATTGYFAPSDDLIALLSRAVRRGVDVRVLATGEATDIRIVRWAGRSIYDRLLRDGVRIYEYMPTMLHAKTMVIDGVLASIGAINFDRRSLEVNDETTLVVNDHAIGRELDLMFHRDLRDAREIELEHFSKRGWVERAWEEMARPLREQL
jgi:cardiolipin synthase A/B